MGAKNSYGAVGRGDTLNFRPEDLLVITDPKHALYDTRVERPFDEAMVLSIMSLGILEPLIIARDGDKVYVVDGRQRRTNAIEANKRLVKQGAEPVVCPCVWRRGDDARLYEVLVAANEVRSGDSPLERAKKMEHLKNLGRDDAQVAVAFGCTTATVKNHRALLECAPAVKRAVESGTVPMTVATQLSKVSRDEQEKALSELVEKGITKGARAVEAARKVKNGKSAESSTVRMMNKNQLGEWKAKLKKIDGKDADIALAVVSRILGSERALANYPRLRESLGAE
jgi:ParB family transcriptional regulator, chromosome partitioning protein